MIEATYIRKAKSWSEFSTSLNSLIEKNKKLQAGKIYEKCVQLFLQTDPKYQAVLKNVWLLQDVPKSVREKLKLPNADEGIDLIAETNRKKYWAIQAKYKSDKSSTLTRKDLATFRDLAFNYCNNIDHGLVCSPISHEPKKSNLMNDMGFALINEWEDLDKDKNKGWKNVQKKLGGKAVKPEKFKPKPHQSKAIKEVIKAFKNNSVERGKMIMPCGTGKSLTAFWITRDMKVNNVLVAIPSLSLLQQTLNVWTKEFLANDIQPDYLCVCSDESAGSLEKDEFTAQTYDLGIPTTTDVDEISSFLKDKNSKFKIIFTTYQSGQATAKASKKAKFTFDLGIMDEAHKTVGHKLKPMAHLLYEKNIKIKKRLFMTATERVYKGGKENEILSMDDPQDYGNNVYQMTYKEAIDAGVVSDYKIVSFNVTDAEYREIIQNNEYIRLNNNPKQNDDVTARELATALALRKTFKKLKISKALSFHSSIRRADKFEDLNKQISRDFKKYPSIETYHVSSKQKSSDRVQEMRSFEQSNKSLMTNARCLTEGVDVPAIDCVAFIDSKRSKVDIVQAAGRAMRISKEKKFGYILVPVITNSGDINSASIDTEYEDLISVITSLATQDERLIDEIKSITKKTYRKYKSKELVKTNVNMLKKVNQSNLEKYIGLKIWDKISRYSHCSFEDAQKFALENNIKSAKEWTNIRNKDWCPLDIPHKPAKIYSITGEWKNWGHFLNTGRIADHLKREIYPNYEEAKKRLKKLNIQSISDYHAYRKKVNFLPNHPPKFYNDFKSWKDFLNLNEEIISTKNRKELYPKISIVINEIKKHEIKSKNEYKSAYRKNLLPKDFPLKLERAYPDYIKKNGIKSIFGTKLEHVSYKEAKKIVRKLNITSFKQYTKRETEIIKYNLPKSPSYFYKKEWKNFADFFGTRNYRSIEYLPFNKAKKIVQKEGLKNLKDWQKYSKTKRPQNIPGHPGNIYKKEWKGFGDFLGTGIKSSKDKKFLKFNEAKRKLKKLNSNKYSSWRDFCTKVKRPEDVPWNPKEKYEDEWKGWDDFLGKK